MSDTAESDQRTILVRVVDEDASATAQGRGDQVPLPPPGEGAHTQSLWPGKKTVKDQALKIADLKESINDITSELEEILDRPKSSGRADGGGFELESFTVGLAITGKGKVVLVGELGIEASVEVTFKRRG